MYKNSFRAILVFFLLCLYSVVYTQVVYTDLAPPIFISQNDSIAFDINADGITDLKFVQFTNPNDGQNFYILPGLNTQVAVENDSAAAFGYGDLIDENQTWSATNNVKVLHHGFYSNSIGNWSRVQNGYLAIRIKVQGQWYYSWIRLHRFREGPSEDFYFEMVYALDLGIEATENQAILAGDGTPSGATSLYSYDGGNMFDGRDIKFSFTKPIDESQFTEYRIILAKAGDSNAMNLEYVNALTEERYSSILVDTSEHNINIDSSFYQETVDMDGDPVNPLALYQVHLLNIAFSGIPDDNVLSQPSEAFLLQDETKPMENIIAKDIANDNTASDIQLIFDAPYSNPYANHYRVFIAPLESLEDFTIINALSLPQNYYTIIEKNHPYPYEITINEGQLDIDGNHIKNDQFYKAIALSVADSINSVTSVFSDPSRQFYLQSPNAFYAGQKEGGNIVWFPYDTILSNTNRWDGIVEEGAPPGNGYSYIDLNRDGEDDFHLKHGDIITAGSRSHYYKIYSLRNNKVLKCSHADHNRWVDVLNEGDIIDEGFEFSNETVTLCSYNRAEGAGEWYTGHIPVDFTGRTFYIGFQINNGDNSQYAWLKLIGNRFVEYGYQTINNGIHDISKPKYFAIYPNPSNGFVRIQFTEVSNSNKDIEISILNNLGSKIEEFKLNQISNSVDLSNYPSGLYFFVIKDQAQVLETHKILVKSRIKTPLQL